jgi:UDP-glucose 4-epimerase
VKILVTGGAGYIGSHAVHQLLSDGHHVVVLDNLYSGHRWAVPTDAKFVEGDIADTALVSKLLISHKIDSLLHFAAHIEVAESVTDPAKYYRNNTASALGLFEACAQNGVQRVIFSSTAAVYGEPQKPGLLRETDVLAPINPYGSSKMMSEKILADICTSTNGRMKFVILRYFNVAGARSDLSAGQATPRATHLIKIAAEAALGLRKNVSVHGSDYPTKDGTCERDYIHVDDLIQAHIDALTYLQDGAASDTFNVGYGRSYSVKEVIEAMKRVCGTDFPVEIAERRAGDAAALVADNSKIKKLLKWQPKHADLDYICRTAFDWEKKLQQIQRG